MFKVIKTDSNSKARRGTFSCAHGDVATPAFFPVATQAAVKGLSPKELDEIGVSGLLMNAYHIFLRPGTEVVEKCGGLHKFMNFSRPIITDSGGYQIFSLEGLRKVSDKGVEFQSHIDGKKFFLTPEEVIKIQLALQPDVLVPLDECVKNPASFKVAEKAVKRTIHWAKRSKDYFASNNGAGLRFFGIIQGSVYPELREYCLKEIEALSPDGLCVGGLSVGEAPQLRYNMLSLISERAAPRYLRYFMGYGRPQDIIEAVENIIRIGIREIVLDQTAGPVRK